MLSRVYSGAVYGVNAYAIEIEVNAGKGDSQFVIVGLPDAAVRESKDRVLTAMNNSGFRPMLGRTTINLAPADIKKEGPVYDLPIAAGLLAATGEAEMPNLDQYALIGELALSGEVRRVRGVLPVTLEMRNQGKRGIIVPSDNAEEAAVAEGIDVYPVRHLREAIDFLAGKLHLSLPLRWIFRSSCSASGGIVKISRMSRARNLPSARLKWQSAAAITCSCWVRRAQAKQ